MERTILPGETELQRSNQLLLTSHRLSLNVNGSSSWSTSILLRDLEWSRIGRSHRPLLAVLAGFAGIVALVALTEEPAYSLLPMIAAVILLVSYYGSRRTTMLFAAGDGRIEIMLAGDAKSRENARIFANAVEHAALRAPHLPL